MVSSWDQQDLCRWNRSHLLHDSNQIDWIENYIDQSIDSRYENLRNARFRKTWIIRDGKNAGKVTIKAPFPSNPDLRVWTGRLPKSELDELVLANNVSLSPQGYLSKDSIDVATGLSISFGSYETIENEEEHLQSLRQANALYTYAQRTLCTCTMLLTEAKQNITDKSGHYNRITICGINPSLYRGKQSTCITDWTHLNKTYDVFRTVVIDTNLTWRLTTLHCQFVDV